MPFRKILHTHVTCGRAAQLLGLENTRHLRRLCATGRVPGAVHIGDGRRSVWLIPLNAGGEPDVPRFAGPGRPCRRPRSVPTP